MITFKKTTNDDVIVISQLADKIWRTYYTSIITIAQIEYMLATSYSPDALSKQIDEGQMFTLIFEEGQAVGYFSVSEKTPNNYFLHKFYIQPTQHGNGIGGKAFHYMLNNYCKGFETLRLQVNRRNVKAVNFYYKMGMTIEYEKDFDIGEGFSMDDFVMVLKGK